MQIIETLKTQGWMVMGKRVENGGEEALNRHQSALVLSAFLPQQHRSEKYRPQIQIDKPMLIGSNSIAAVRIQASSLRASPTNKVRL